MTKNNTNMTKNKTKSLSDINGQIVALEASLANLRQARDVRQKNADSQARSEFVVDLKKAGFKQASSGCYKGKAKGYDVEVVVDDVFDSLFINIQLLSRKYQFDMEGLISSHRGMGIDIDGYDGEQTLCVYAYATALDVLRGLMAGTALKTYTAEVSVLSTSTKSVRFFLNDTYENFMDHATVTEVK